MSINKPSDLSGVKLWAAALAALSAGTISAGVISGGTLAGDGNAVTIVPDQSGNNAHLTASPSPYMTANDGVITCDEAGIAILTPSSTITIQNNSFTIAFVGKVNSFLSTYFTTGASRAIQTNGSLGAGSGQNDGLLTFYDGSNTIYFTNGALAAATPTTRTLFAIVGNTSNCCAYVDGVTYGATGTFASGSTTWSIGGLLGYTSTDSNFEITDIIVRNVPSTAADLANLFAWAQINRGAGAPRNPAEPAFQGTLCIPGASITAGHLVTARYRFASQMQIPQTIQVSTPCQSSRLTTSFTTVANSNTSPYVKSGMLNMGLIFDTAYNDINITGSTGAVTYANVLALISRMKGEGFNKIVVSTLPGFGNVTSGSDVTAIAAYNTLVYAGLASGAIDAIADLASDPHIGPAGSGASTTYFQSDHVHFTNAGHALAAAYFSNAVNGLIGSATNQSSTSLIFGASTTLAASEVLTGTNYNAGGRSLSGVLAGGAGGTQSMRMSM